MEKEMQDVVEQFKTVKSFAQDYIEYCRSREVVQNYVRSDAIILLNELTQKYRTEINEIGFFLDGVFVINGINYDDISDIQIIEQLIYLGQRIPAYAFIREGNRRIAKILLSKIGFSGFVI